MVTMDITPMELNQLSKIYLPKKSCLLMITLLEILLLVSNWTDFKLNGMEESLLKLRETISSARDLMMVQDFGLMVLELLTTGVFMDHALSLEKLVSTKVGTISEPSCSKMVEVQKWKLFIEVQIPHNNKIFHSKLGTDQSNDRLLHKIFKNVNTLQKYFFIFFC